MAVHKGCMQVQCRELPKLSIVDFDRNAPIEPVYTKAHTYLRTPGTDRFVWQGNLK